MNKDDIKRIIIAKDKKDNYHEYLDLVESVKKGLIIDIKFLLSFYQYDKDYIKLRAFILIANLAREDKIHFIDDNTDIILSILYSSKPTIVRQVIANLPVLINNKPALKNTINEALDRINYHQFKDTLVPLIKTDISLLKENYL